MTSAWSWKHECRNFVFWYWLLLTFCARHWPIFCIMFLWFRKDQPCGAGAFYMFFCWHVTRLPHWLLVNGEAVQRIQAHVVHLPVFSILMCGYVKMPFHPPDQKRRWYTQSGHFYISSTAISALKPEVNRQDRFWIVHVYCFASMRNVRHCTTMPGSVNMCKLVLGNLLWIIPSKFLKLKSEGWLMQLQKNRQGPVKLNPRLYQRVRRRLFSLRPVPSPHSFQEQAWTISYQISLFTRASFEACKRIRSGESHNLEIYASYRLATHMEEPGRSSAKSLIGKALLFRNATVPRNNLPLHIPFLAHDSFYNIKLLQFLSFYQLMDSEGFPKLSEILHNHRRMEGRWKTSHIQNLPCCCTVLQSIAKQHIQKTYVFPFPVICSKVVTRWLKHHGLPPQLAPVFMQKIIAQWKLHFDAIDNIPIFPFMLLAVQHLLHWLPKDCVIHLVVMNHEYFRLTLFCPQLYFQGPSIFGMIRNFLNNSWSASLYSTGFRTYLVRTYPWGFRKKATLPCRMDLSFWKGKKIGQKVGL